MNRNEDFERDDAKNWGEGIQPEAVGHRRARAKRNTGWESSKETFWPNSFFRSRVLGREIRGGLQSVGLSSREGPRKRESRTTHKFGRSSSLATSR